MAQTVQIVVTARTKIEGNWESRSKEIPFPKFDPELRNMIEHFSAQTVFEKVYDAWMIEKQGDLRREIEAEFEDGNGGTRSGKKQSALQQLGLRK